MDVGRLKKLTLVIFSSFHIIPICIAQKKLVDFEVSETWPRITNPAISNDGKYVFFNQGSEASGYDLVVISTSDNRKEVIAGGFNAVCTPDSRRLIFQKFHDSVGILELDKKDLRYIGQVKSFKISSHKKNNWLAYHLGNTMNELVLQNLNTGAELRFPECINYLLSENGQSLILQITDSTYSSIDNDLYWLDLKSGHKDKIFHGRLPGEMVFDQNGEQMAFFVRSDKNWRNPGQIFTYRVGADSAELVVDSRSPGMEDMKVMEGNLSFSKNGDKILFAIGNIDKIIDNKPPDINIRLYNYLDDSLRIQLSDGPFLAALNFNDKNRKVIRLQKRNESNVYFWTDANNEDDIVIPTDYNFEGSLNEYKWRNSARPSLYTISSKDGSRKLIAKEIISRNMDFSPGGKYFLWYDNEKKHWFTYNMRSGFKVNATKHISKPLFYLDDHPDFPSCEGLAGWIENDEYFLVYDRYDVWKVDPTGVKWPINLTHGYGSKNNIQFRVINFGRTSRQIYHQGDTLILSAFNLLTKYNGFFKLPVETHGDPVLLVMEPKLFCPPFPSNPTLAFSGAEYPFDPVKAKDAGIYLTTQSSADNFPNLYLTTDFTNFRPVTNLSPQREYNWYRSELIAWKMDNGVKLEGILFKPENFDPLKKYPVIFYYYEKSADALNVFIRPDLSPGSLNIPWFVSNGYLVFVPDISYKTGSPGESACSAVISAAAYLSKKTWVDKTKLGLQGHSYGGWETNYIVTRSNLFTAAAPSSGISDAISSYNQYVGGNIGREQYFYEVRWGRIGASLWDRQDLYILNSPIFKADKVNTPLLILHNKNDGIVLFNQGAEWYNALNRLGKKIWLLSYENEGHTIDSKKNQLDYSIRLGQFFDHYLKGAPAPRWMTEGEMALKRGISYSLQLDSVNKKP